MCQAFYILITWLCDLKQKLAKDIATNNWHFWILWPLCEKCDMLKIKNWKELNLGFYSFATHTTMYLQDIALIAQALFQQMLLEWSTAVPSYFNSWPGAFPLIHYQLIIETYSLQCLKSPLYALSTFYARQMLCWKKKKQAWWAYLSVSHRVALLSTPGLEWLALIQSPALLHQQEHGHIKNIVFCYMSVKNFVTKWIMIIMTVH